MIAIEVRCCCQPKKLLGWMLVRDELVRRGARIRFHIPPRADFRRMAIDGGMRWTEPAQIVELPVEEFLEHGRGHLALKSEETPIETLRKVREFLENPDV